MMKEMEGNVLYTVFYCLHSRLCYYLFTNQSNVRFPAAETDMILSGVILLLESCVTSRKNRPRVLGY